MDEERGTGAGRTASDEAERAGAADDASLDPDDADANLAPDRPPRPPIEPESVDPEHAVFVVIGATLTVAVVAGVL